MNGQKHKSGCYFIAIIVYITHFRYFSRHFKYFCINVKVSLQNAFATKRKYFDYLFTRLTSKSTIQY